MQTHQQSQIAQFSQKCWIIKIIIIIDCMIRYINWIVFLNLNLWLYYKLETMLKADTLFQISHAWTLNTRMATLTSNSSFLHMWEQRVLEIVMTDTFCFTFITFTILWADNLNYAKHRCKYLNIINIGISKLLQNFAPDP